MTTLDARLCLSDLDALLADGAPFGDSAYIRTHMQSSYRRRLAEIADTTPAAATLLGALDGADENTQYRVYGDTVVRAAIQHAASQLTTGIPYGLPLRECARIFSETEQRIGDGQWRPELNRLGGESHHGFIWNDDGSDDALSRAFRYLVRRNFTDPVGSPNIEAIQSIRHAVALLDDVIPAVTASALSHAHLVALFPSTGQWKTRASCSQFRLVGTVFLRRQSLDDPWWTAEHLLHEALHQKLYDIRHGHSLMAYDTSDDPDEHEVRQDVVSIWNVADAANSNRWTISRALAAFHVYAHLALFGMLADERLDELQARWGPRSKDATPRRRALTTTRSAHERALYLADEIRRWCWDDLGPAGKCLIDWLDQFLDTLASSPGRDAVCVDLAIERYRREADMLRSRAALDDQATHLLTELITDEITTVRHVMTMVGLTGTVPDLAASVAQLNAAPPQDVFARNRHQIAEALDGQTLEVDSLTGEQSPNTVIHTMIDRSSATLQPLLSAPNPTQDQELPPPAAPSVAYTGSGLADLMELTNILGAGYGTEDLCLFLHSLVRMHRPQTIVELGTGFGASALSMALAAQINGHGHVWTVDDFAQIGKLQVALNENTARLESTRWTGLAALDTSEVLTEVILRLTVEDSLTLVRREMTLDAPGHFDDYGFTEPVDLLFCDFTHGPIAVLQILRQFLPKMAPASSIFIDSASTAWTSYLLLEQIVDQLNHGHVPALLQEETDIDLSAAIRNRRIILVHLTRGDDRTQNSTAWLKLEPIDVRPYPKAFVRGLSDT